MREFDTACLEPVKELKPKTIRELRKREQGSQPVFAVYLNVSKSLVSDWERGEKPRRSRFAPLERCAKIRLGCHWVVP